MKKYLTFIALIIFLIPFETIAGFKLKWVEVDVSLNKDGKAVISYMVRWACSNANLHGFYFEGFQENPVFDFETAHAVDHKNNNYKLDIKRIP